MTVSQGKFWRPPAMWQGETVYIIGGGPSLEKEAMYPDFAPLHSQRVIGVNDAYTLGSWVDVCFFGDPEWYAMHNKIEVPSSKGAYPGLKVFGGLIVSNNDATRKEPDVLTTMRRVNGFHVEQGYVGWNLNSGAAAINLAAYFGAKKIVLIGFDLKLSKEGKGNWHPNSLDPKEMKFDRMLAGFKSLKDGMDQLRPDIQVINANLDSALDFWPKVDLKKILEGKKIAKVPEKKILPLSKDSIELRDKLEVTDKTMLTDTRFTELVAGKRVALVGPAPYLLGKGYGPAFDQYDVVCRVNECWPFGHEADYGQHTDIVFHSGAKNTMGNMHKSLRHNPFLVSELRFVVAAQKAFNKNENLLTNIGELNSNLEAYCRMGQYCQIMIYCAGNDFWDKVFTEIGRPTNAQTTARGDVHGPNTGTMALRILLAHNPAEVLVTGFSFFKEGHAHAISHHSAYMEWGGNDFKGTQNNVHSQDAQRLYFSEKLLPHYGSQIKIDNYMAEALEIEHENMFYLDALPAPAYAPPAQLLHLFKGKSVVMAGPSPHLQGKGQGEKIDAYDVVCRTNEIGAFGLEHDYGSRTDVLFHCGGMPATERLLQVAESHPTTMKGVKAIVIPQRTTTDVVAALKRLGRPVHIVPESVWWDMNRRIGTYGNTGLLGLVWLMEHCQPESVRVTGWSFYQQGLKPEQRHHEAYKEWGGDAKSATQIIPLDGQPAQFRQLPQFRYFSRVLRPAHKNLSCDRFLNALIKKDRLRYVVYRAFYGQKYIRESIESILPYVDKVFVFIYHKAWGGITEVLNEGKYEPIPEDIDGIEDVVKAIPSSKVKVILDDWPLPDNQFTHLVNDRILPWNLKPDTILSMETDMIWRPDQIEAALEEFEGSGQQVASSRTIELWREPKYAIAERDRPACIFWDMRSLKEIPTTGKSADVRGMSRLNAIVHNYGLCLDEETMRWKHMLGIAFAKAIKDSPPDPAWLENKWLSWDYETNNSNLGISLGHAADIPRADLYPVEDLPKIQEEIEMRSLKEYDFKSAVDEWQKPPVDNVGYVKVTTLLNFPDQILMDLMAHAAEERYNLEGWRNYQNKWRELLGLDTTQGKLILDFGCGIGIESVEFARAGNEIILADIVSNNLVLADKVLKLSGYDVLEKLLVKEDAPFFNTSAKVDIFYANGVLHHTPLFREILLRAVEVLAPDGEIRLMLYSDKGWTWATKTSPPPIEADVRDHPKFDRFVSAFDGVGFYANWFSREKIRHLVGDFLDLVACEHITKDGRYLVATLKPKRAQ